MDYLENIFLEVIEASTLDEAIDVAVRVEYMLERKTKEGGEVGEKRKQIEVQS